MRIRKDSRCRSSASPTSWASTCCPGSRNWADLVFYRPTPQVRYRHIDALFDPDTAINWRLIERDWPDIMRTALSIPAVGRVLLRTHGIGSLRRRTRRLPPHHLRLRNTLAYMTSILSWVCARIGMSRSE